MDFQLAKKLIDVGYEEAKKESPKIKELLKENNISLHKNKNINKERINVSETLNDIKYDRMILDSNSFKPLFYFGKDHSLFKQNLFKDELFKPQYGLEFDNGKLETTLLNNNYKSDDLEAKIRLKKITQNLDLIAKSKLNSNQDHWEFGFKHYAKRHTFSLGRKKINDKKFNIIKNRYNIGLDDSSFKGETSLLITPKFDSYKILTSHQGLFKISSIWSLKPKIVFNNTKLITSPTIYRGSTPEDTVKFQTALDFIYTHNFLPSLEFMQILQITNIKFYLFSDYQTSHFDSQALGVGSEMNLYFPR
jgi:NTE family protein